MPHQLSLAGASRPPQRTGTGTLILCGTGMRLGQMTLETFDALKWCERIFCVNLPRDVFRQVRKSFKQAEDITAGHPLGDGFSEEALCERIESLWGRQKDAGVLFLGHPLLYSAAPELIKRCRKSKSPCRILAGLSAIDAALAAAGSVLTDRGLDLYGAGFAVHNAPEALRMGLPFDRRFSAFFLNLFRLWQEFPGEDAVWERWVDHLERHYTPGQQAVWIHCGSDSREDRPVLTTVAGLRRAALPIASDVTLFLPMRRS